MNYGLAKQLKDAGFPQVDLGGFNFQENLNYPTLSELIEACGEDFDYLSNKGESWRACSGDVKENGQIPEEAVANLWLALNKK